MAGNQFSTGIRFNDPVAKYMRFEMDMTTMKLVVYVTGVVGGGTEATLKGTITQSGWSPAKED